MKITIIGNGAVGGALKRACDKVGSDVIDGFAAITEVSDSAAQGDVQLFILAVPDRVIGEVAAGLPREAIIVHTSGTTPMDVISQQHRGVLYPLQTFSRGREVDLSEVPFLVEWSTDEARAALLAVANSLSSNVLEASSELRARAHLAAVFACNFTNYMLATATRVVHQAGLPDNILHPLIRETVNKALSVADPTTVQTGPAIRGDSPTIARHLEMLTGANRDIYEIITKAINDKL